MEKKISFKNLKPDMKYNVLDLMNKEIRSNLSRKGINQIFNGLVNKYKHSIMGSEEISLNVVLVGMKKKKEENVAKISETFKEMKNIKVLKAILEHNTLSDDDIKLLFSPIKEFTSLIRLELNLESNQITKFGLKTIVDTFSYLTKLQYLDIKLKNNTFDTIEEFSKGIGILKGIKVLKLNIYNKKLKTNYVRSLTDSIIQLSSLEKIKIDLQHSTNANINNLDRMLNKLSNLREFELNLSNTFIGEKALHTLNDSFARSKIYFEKFLLDLGYNRINSKSLKLMNDFWKNFNLLTSLTLLLTSNNIDDTCMEYLSKSIFSLSNLNYLNLDLSKNNINEKGGNDFFKGLNNLGKLTNLNLNFKENCLGSSVNSFVLANLTNLSEIRINFDNNSIDKEISEYLFYLFSNLPEKIIFYVLLGKNHSTITELKR